MLRKTFLPPTQLPLNLDEFQVVNYEPHFYNNFSMMSLNVCSLHGKYEELRDFLSGIQNRFSIICLQEVWSVSHEYPLEGYQTIECNTQDALLPVPNLNCGGVLESTLMST